jgi:hypothetical protein
LAADEFMRGKRLTAPFDAEEIVSRRMPSPSRFVCGLCENDAGVYAGCGGCLLCIGQVRGDEIFATRYMRRKTALPHQRIDPAAARNGCPA